MSSWPPAADEITELPVDELALRMLRHFAASPDRQFHRNNDATNTSTWHRIGQEYISSGGSLIDIKHDCCTGPSP